MADLLGPGGLESRDDRMALQYSLAKAWMDAGDGEKAFAYLNEGSRHGRARPSNTTRTRPTYG